jgi:multisubunit Na+/H+ antiporter MnhE subunit
MTIPYSINILICLVTFVAALLEYYVVDPERRIFNLHFGLAVAAIVLAFVNIFMKDTAPSVWLFLISVVLCGFTLYQIRLLPQRHDDGQ